MGNSSNTGQARRAKTWQPRETNLRTNQPYVNTSRHTTTLPNRNTNAIENKENLNNNGNIMEPVRDNLNNNGNRMEPVRDNLNNNGNRMEPVRDNLNNNGNRMEPVRDNLGIFVGNPRNGPPRIGPPRIGPSVMNHNPPRAAPMIQTYPQVIQPNPYRVFPRLRDSQNNDNDDDIPVSDEFGPDLHHNRPINRPTLYGDRSPLFPPMYGAPHQTRPIPYFRRHSYGVPYSYHNYPTYHQQAPIYVPYPVYYDAMHTSGPPVPSQQAQEPVIVEHVPHQKRFPIETPPNDTGYRATTAAREAPTPEGLRTINRPSPGFRVK